MKPFFRYLGLLFWVHTSFPAIGFYRVCLTQFISHPSLDLIRQGIIDELNKQDLPMDISFYNPSGQMSSVLQIAQTCVGKRPDVIVALATPMAQGVAKVLKGKQIPFVFGAITDPVGAGLVPDFISSQATITGTIDTVDPAEQLAFFRSINPLLQTLCVLFNPAEANSVRQVEALAQAATDQGITIIKQSVSKLSDLAMAMAFVIGKAQAFFIPNDNLLVSGIETVVKIAHQAQMPVYASDPESVQRGADAAFANDQYKVGQETGKLVARALRGESFIPIQKVNAPLKIKSSRPLLLDNKP